MTDFFAANITRQIHDAQGTTFEQLRRAGVIPPELAKLEQQRKRVRYEKQDRIRFEVGQRN